ncbi:MAG: pyrroloquinoline quinone biosynthesis peptide chaperone PqqD [Rhodocyclaceae bacterium]|nr:MAG: pyrroloquinoline quinone biosynthesis peptide chaperone PqqD [Rhodocyclaceae bacterium]
MTQEITAALPRLGHGFRFQWEPAQDCHVLLYPEGMVKLNRSGGEILARCDGKTTVAAIVTDLEKTFAMAGLAAEVCAFLQMAAERNWVVLATAPGAGV